VEESWQRAEHIYIDDGNEGRRTTETRPNGLVGSGCGGFCVVQRRATYCGHAIVGLHSETWEEPRLATLALLQCAHACAGIQADDSGVWEHARAEV
jgi:hypothetical protein